MIPKLRTLAPSLAVALSTLLASAIVVGWPHARWPVFLAPAVLLAALLGAELLRGRRLSASSAIIAVAVIGACCIVGAGDRAALADLVPLLGACTAVPSLVGAASRPRRDAICGPEQAP